MFRLGFSSFLQRPAARSPIVQCLRQRSQLAPKNVKYAKRHKGKIPIPIGGSIKGTTLAFGEYGIRVRGNGGRLSADHLTVAEDAIKRQLKPVKGAKIYMRVFPNIPVSVKGNETRMGKGKGPFEYWAVRVPTGRVLFEIGGVPIREELARAAFAQAAAKLPLRVAFVKKGTPPRLGSVDILPGDRTLLHGKWTTLPELPSSEVS